VTSKNKKLTIGQAKEARKNINEAVYTRHIPSGVKNKLKEVTGALDEFIETFGPNIMNILSVVKHRQ